MSTDPSHGYDAVAEQFARLRSDAGVDTVSDWAARLPAGASVLDVGAGTGLPLAQTLVQAGLRVTALDASPRMCSYFRDNLPGTHVTCANALTSPLLEIRYEGVLCVGLIFLFPLEDQPRLLDRLARAVSPGGRLLISVPRETGSWRDLLTYRPSHSLGRADYTHHLEAAGLSCLRSHTDSAGTHYLEAVRLL